MATNIALTAADFDANLERVADFVEAEICAGVDPDDDFLNAELRKLAAECASEAFADGKTLDHWEDDALRMARGRRGE